VPLLDTPLVEFVGALPEGARRRDGPRRIACCGIGDLLPQEVFARRKGRLHCHGKIGCGRIAEALGPACGRWPGDLDAFIFGQTGVDEVGERFLRVRPRGRGRGRFTC